MIPALPRAGALLAVSAAALIGTASPALGGPVAVKACTKATIAGKARCIAAGQVCTPRYASQYKRYGFSCTRPGHKGRYRLARSSLTF